MEGRDYWVYQKRQVNVPWAICIYKEWPRGKHNDYVLGFTIYSELIDNSSHSQTIEGLKGDTLDYYVSAITDVLDKITEVHQEDVKQLEREILNILIQW